MKKYLFLAALTGAAGVVISAFGQHALAGNVEPRLLSAFDTGGRYQLIHAVAMAVAALAPRGAARPWAQRAAALFFVGILLFSGSLYALVLTGIRVIGVLTPFGGVTLIAGWLSLAMAAWKWDAD
jgi:uncharacterized membrane protein YgdD (TMEM256/DUF423 family)